MAQTHELVKALEDLVQECEEYARINHLHNDDGSPATTGAMKHAYRALALARRTSATHDALVKALERARQQLVTLAGDWHQSDRQFGDAIQASVLDQIDAALTLARGA